MNIKNEITNAIKTVIAKNLDEMLKERFVQYDKVASSFQRLFNLDNLTEVLSRKADITQMDF
jgi:hypothetical protein